MDTYEAITYSLYTNTKDLSYKNGIIHCLTISPPALAVTPQQLVNRTKSVNVSCLQRSVGQIIDMRSNNNHYHIGRLIACGYLKIIPLSPCLTGPAQH